MTYLVIRRGTEDRVFMGNKEDCDHVATQMNEHHALDPAHDHHAFIVIEFTEEETNDA